MKVFGEVAFGDAPGRWPLPTASTATEHWLRAVAAGGQGRYASALADLDVLAAARPGPALASLGCSTRASFLRQLGGHAAARGWDGRASARAGGDPEAEVDALVGLAADALGVGRYALSARLLHGAAALLGPASGRLPIRLAWVGAELAMCTGDGSAVAHAERAVEAAAGWTSARHAAKSQVVLAAALCSAGDAAASRRVAEAALQTTQQLGLTPLSWAVTSLLVGVGSSTRSTAEISGMRDAFAATVRRRGGVWTAR